MSLSSSLYIVSGVLIAALVCVTQCQRAENKTLRADVAQLTGQISDLETQLAETIEQRDAERRRIIETAHRLDEALTLFVNNSEEAHYDHEERMEELSNIESPEAVDWLCEPVPDDIRMLLGCGAAAGDIDRGEARTADGIDAALH